MYGLPVIIFVMELYERCCTGEPICLRFVHNCNCFSPRIDAISISITRKKINNFKVNIFDFQFNKHIVYIQRADPSRPHQRYSHNLFSSRKKLLYILHEFGCQKEKKNNKKTDCHHH